MGTVTTNVLITGGAGLVATHLVRARPAGVEVTITWRSRAPSGDAEARRVELTDAVDVQRLFEQVRPDVVVHTAYARDRRSDTVDSSLTVAQACSRSGAAMVHLSSDAVFDGTAAPYVESDPMAPVNDYGRDKADAERAVLGALPDACITRTSLVVGHDPLDPVSASLLQAVRSGAAPTLFTDEIRSPILAEDLAGALWALVGMDRTLRAGVWHLPGPESISRWQLGQRVLRRVGLGTAEVRPGSVLEHPEPRPVDLTMHTERVRPGTAPGPVR